MEHNDAPPPNIPESAENMLPLSSRGIQTMLREVLVGKNISPSRNISSLGAPAFFSMGEIAEPDIFEEAREYDPDGYIIAVGAGPSFAMLRAFREGSPPKGVIVADANPLVVVGARFLVQTIQEHDTWSAFNQAFFTQSIEDIAAKLQTMRQNDPDKTPYERLEQNEYTVDDVARVIRALMHTPVPDPEVINVPEEIQRAYPTLHALASTDNIAVMFTDISTPEFAEAIETLPDFNRLRHVFYGSNAIEFHVDLTQDASHIEKQITSFEDPWKNRLRQSLCFDTLTSLTFHIRQQVGFPHYTIDDL